MNIYDIAKEANVSIATVSRVINGSGHVRDITRQKVEAVLKKHHYIPSAIARGMMTNSMKTIGIVTIDIRDLYYAKVSYSIEQALSVLGFNTILCNTGYDTDQKIRYLHMLAERKVDSIIMVGSIFKDPKLEKPVENISKFIPIVIINGYYGYPNIYSIQCDDKTALKKSVDFLAAKGRSRFIYLYDADTFSGNQKLMGFKESISHHRIDSQIHFIKPGLDEAFHKTQALIHAGVSFDAVLCSEDLTAIGALQCLMENQIAVPDQVSVMGFNNSILSLCCTPKLSTIDSMMETMGETAVKTLHNVLLGIPTDNDIMIEPRLVFRQTT